jgi:hypothetical protein
VSVERDLDHGSGSAPRPLEHALDLEAVMDLADIIASLQDLSDEELNLRGLAVDGTWDEVDDPVLLGPDGTPVDTWREGYPYSECRGMSTR